MTMTKEEVKEYFRVKSVEIRCKKLQYKELQRKHSKAQDNLREKINLEMKISKSMYDLRKMQVEYRLYHIMYSLKNGTPIDKIEKNNRETDIVKEYLTSKELSYDDYYKSIQHYFFRISGYCTTNSMKRQFFTGEAFLEASKYQKRREQFKLLKGMSLY